MDWLFLVLGVPAILIPLVVLFGFAGCGLAQAGFCTEDSDCPLGTECVDGACLATAQPPPSAPSNLHAISNDDHSVTLTWTNNEPAATDFEIERAEDGGDFGPVIPAPQNVSATGGTDTNPAGLQEGVQEGLTYVYRVSAVVGSEPSRPSEDTPSVTVLPKAPVNLVATPAGINLINVSWDNVSAVATVFSLGHRVPGAGARFVEIFRGRDTSYTDPRPVEGAHEYQVFAIVPDGFKDDAQQDVFSAATTTSVTFAFTAAFTAPPGTPTNELGEGVCLVQRLRQPFLAGGTQVRITLRGSTAGDLTLDRITISQVDPAGGDPYDSDTDLTDVASGVSVPQNATVTVPPVNYTLDPARDLLVAFDISSATGQGNLSYVTPAGGDAYSRPTTAEAGVPNRTPNYPGFAADSVYLIEKIEVL